MFPFSESLKKGFEVFLTNRLGSVEQAVVFTDRTGPTRLQNSRPLLPPHPPVTSPSSADMQANQLQMFPWFRGILESSLT